MYPNIKSRVLFDYFSPRGEGKDLENTHREIANDWEIVVGRQYLTMAVELMWKHMLWELVDSLTLENWSERSINNSEWTIDYYKPLSSLIPECNFNFTEREALLSKGSGSSKSHEMNLEIGVKILLSIYNRFFDFRCYQMRL